MLDRQKAVKAPAVGRLFNTLRRFYLPHLISISRCVLLSAQTAELVGKHHHLGVRSEEDRKRATDDKRKERYVQCASCAVLVLVSMLRSTFGDLVQCRGALSSGEPLCPHTDAQRSSTVYNRI